MLLSARSLLLLSAILPAALGAPQYTEDVAETRQLHHDRADHHKHAPPPLPTLTLPPPTGLNLKVITLGVGTQNYTCNSTSGTYGTNVALAQLYDATRYLSKHPDEVSTLSHERLAAEDEHDDCREEQPHLKHIGEHFFADKVPLLPDFDLYELNLFLDARAVQKIAAPDAAHDVDWVYLSSSGSSETKGLKAVYRVETAGGKPPASCSGSEQIFIPYAALYWFYD